jgi:hypothetical protein
MDGAKACRADSVKREAENVRPNNLKAKVAIAWKIAVVLHCIRVDGTSFDWGVRSRPDLVLQVPGPVRAGLAMSAGTVVVVTPVKSAGGGLSARRCTR